MPRSNFYAGLELNRFSERRRDTAFIDAHVAGTAARVIPVWRSRSLVLLGETPRACFLEPGAIERVGSEPRLVVFLGERDGASYFALDVSGHEEHRLPEIFGRDVGFVDLRAVGATMDRAEGSLLAYARGILHWHARHRHCSVCGAPTRVEAAGHVRRCTDAACNAEHFPRTDPAVIMLVTHEDHALLGRQRIWPAGMHSTLAGFVEPGESLEEAVAREVFEEAGVRVEDVRYNSSQPWPFPASIMLGFHARARSRDLAVDVEELETANWFSRDFLLRSHDPDSFRLPRPDSIARRLIEDWLASGPG
jgi:NAD+ diphosphatase